LFIMGRDFTNGVDFPSVPRFPGRRSRRRHLISLPGPIGARFDLMLALEMAAGRWHSRTENAFLSYGEMTDKDPNRIRARKNLLAWRITNVGPTPSERSKIFCRHDGDQYRWYHEDGEATEVTSPVRDGLAGAKAAARQAWAYCDIKEQGIRYHFHPRRGPTD
jgi:hypothetical protein